MEVNEISARIDYTLQKQKAGLVLDEYKKSLLMTRAQERFVTQVLGAYEYTDAMRHILGPLIVTETVITFPSPDLSNPNMYPIAPVEGVKAIVYEYLNENIMLIPLDWNDIHKTRPNPFRKPYSKLAYRITGKDKFTIFTTENPTKYVYVYCREPKPIVLESFVGTTLSVNGSTITQTSELPYDSILSVIDMAVQLAMQEAGAFAPKQREERN